MANNKLYPPYIEGVIPSFFGDTISVPYSMNRAVSAKDVRGYSLKIKSVQNNFLGTVNIFCDYAISSPVSFTIPESIMKELRVGEFYKIQLAYIGEGNQISPYYSTVGVIKYTDKPNVFIDGLEAGQVAGHKYDYLGVYENQDKSEKVYSYNFKIFDQNDLVIADTGELIHNNTFDTEPQISYDNFSFKKDLEKGFSYYIQYVQG